MKRLSLALIAVLLLATPAAAQVERAEPPSAPVESLEDRLDRAIEAAERRIAEGQRAADAFDEGLAAYLRGDNAAALHEWRPLAEQGHATAQYNLGVKYNIGQGVPQDHAEAAKWFRLAAEQGDAYAQYNLGIMYDKGEGVPQDHTEAARWYRMAAEQGHVAAQYNLGVMYDNGEGVPQDHAEAAKWFRLAAVKGNAHAQYNLGVMYAIGLGVPQDYVFAHMWYNLAASRGMELAASNRAYVAGRMTPDQIAEAQRLAREWQAAFEGRR